MARLEYRLEPGNGVAMPFGKGTGLVARNFVATHSEHKGSGLARALTQRAIFASATSAEPALDAFIRSFRGWK